MGERMMQLPECVYDEICKTLTDFENALTDDNEDGWMSDGDWLDVFYALMIEILYSIVQ